MVVVNPVLRDCYAFCASSANVHVTTNRSRIAQLAKSLSENVSTLPPWAEVDLHPSPKQRSPEFMLSWIFLVSLLNFSFWPDEEGKPFGVEWKREMDKRGSRCADELTLWTGYKSLPALINRALDAGVDILSPKTWTEMSDDNFQDFFRSSTEVEIPLYSLRVQIMRETGDILIRPPFNGTPFPLIDMANQSALSMAELLTSFFPSFDDKSVLETPIVDSASLFDEMVCFADETIQDLNPVTEVKIRKRAQILVAELWAAFEGTGIGTFVDIDSLTCFADYRIPQILQSPSFSILSYSSHLKTLLDSKTVLKSGSLEELCIRANSIVAVDMLVKEMKAIEVAKGINAVKVDFWLWEEAKRREGSSGPIRMEEFHRTRSCFY